MKTNDIDQMLVYWRPENLSFGANSSYDDDEWNFSVNTPGQNQKSYRVNWRALDEGALPLIHPSNRRLYEELKCLVWTLHYDRREGARIQERSTTSLESSLKALVPWMMERNFTSLSQISNQASWNYLNWLRDNYARERRGKKRQRDFTFSTAWRALRILTMVYEQSDAMLERGYPAMSEPPFDSRNAFDVVVRDLGLSPGAKLDAFPDEVAIPILVEATRWVLERADDVVKLCELWAKDISPLTNANRRMQRQKEIYESFAFTIDPITAKPWMTLGSPWSRPGYDGVVREIYAADVPRRLVSDLVSACLIVLQGMTGMRSSDLASLQTAPQGTNVFPSCIERRLSLDGLTEVFLVKGVEQKSSHEAHSWVLGQRLVGTEDIPIPLQAIVVLDKLLAPYRNVAKTTALLVTFASAKSLSIIESNVGSPSAPWFTNSQRDFIRFAVNLPVTKHTRSVNEVIGTDGIAFRGAQWRDTFAIFVIRTNKRALGPLATHFNHADVLMTEHGYIGNDPELMQLVEDARISLATNVLYQLITDAEPFAGGLQSHIRENSTELKGDLLAMPEDEGRLLIHGMVTEHDLRLHFTDYGSCGIAITPVIARCHELAGTPSQEQYRPEFGVRRPGVCAGCRNFLISTENLEFWIEREKQLSAFKNTQPSNVKWRLGREHALAKQFVRTLEAGRISEHKNDQTP